jgi:hypothetical protein
MGENKIIKNLFEVAIEKNELSQFFLGKGEYFVKNREFGDHWPYGSYKYYLEPYLKEHGEEKFWQGLFELFIKEKDISIVLNVIVNYLTPFYNPSEMTIKEERVKKTPEKFISTFKEALIKNKAKLIINKRSIGADWAIGTNKGLGLWGGIINSLEIIEKRGGVNLIPLEE